MCFRISSLTFSSHSFTFSLYYLFTLKMLLFFTNTLYLFLHNAVSQSRSAGEAEALTSPLLAEAGHGRAEDHLLQRLQSQQEQVTPYSHAVDYIKLRESLRWLFSGPWDVYSNHDDVRRYYSEQQTVQMRRPDRLRHLHSTSNRCYQHD